VAGGRETFGLAVNRLEIISTGNQAAGRFPIHNFLMRCVMKHGISRRALISGVAAAGALAGGSRAAAQEAPGIRGFDHVALPMEHTEEMLAFYRGLGLQVIENANACSVYVGNQMINFHRPAHWQDKAFTLRAPAAKPPCGDLCFLWGGTPESLKAMLDRAGAKVVEGPVERQGGRKKTGSSVYVRDPDGNLLEFMIYL
jgi:catechol 2,3-dioxygenase-like lactoylglutathione lyase family enzyme